MCFPYIAQVFSSSTDGFMHGFVSVKQAFDALPRSSLKSHLPALRGHETTFCCINQETGESSATMRWLAYKDKMRVIRS